MGLFRKNQPVAPAVPDMPMGLAEDKHPALQIFDDRELCNSVKSGRRMLWSTALMIGSGVMAAFGGLYYVYSQNPDRFSKTPYVYFEVRAIDESGHPLAGSRVKFGEQSVGVTDSFGEWRQFMRLKLGSSVKLSLEKAYQGGTLFAAKNLVVPLRRPAAGDVEIKQTIQLTANGTAKVETPVANEPAVTESAQIVNDDAPTTTEETSSDKFAYNRINVKITSAGINAKTNPTGFERESYLTNGIMPQVKQKLIRAGLAMDSESPWIVSLRHISAGDGQSLIRVESTLDGKTVSFLRNYTTDPSLVADQIFAQLRFHTERPYQVLRDNKVWYAIQPNVASSFWKLTEGDKLVTPRGEVIPLAPAQSIAGIQRIRLATDRDPCTDYLDATGQCYLNRAGIKFVAPREGLSLQKIRFNPTSKDAALYVLGFAAQPVADGVYQYWASSGEKAKVTLINNSKVTMRTEVVSRPGHLASLPVAKESVASR